jgi:hypothetical protein
MLHTSITPRPLQAFCQSCPSVENVKAVLAPLGFSQTLSMKAYAAFPDRSVPALPAQYHFDDGKGTEVLYLAGKDHSPEEGKQFPAHQSRLWVYPGHDPARSVQAIALLSRQWLMAWFPLNEQEGQ